MSMYVWSLVTFAVQLWHSYACSMLTRNVLKLCIELVDTDMYCICTSAVGTKWLAGVKMVATLLMSMHISSCSRREVPRLSLCQTLLSRLMQSCNFTGCTATSSMQINSSC